LPESKKIKKILWAKYEPSPQEKKEKKKKRERERERISMHQLKEITRMVLSHILGDACNHPLGPLPCLELDQPVESVNKNTIGSCKSTLK
jgi:hypothetical protein